MEKFLVTFLPDNLSVSVAKDTTILAAAISAQIYINSACGGDGICGKCKVIVRGQVTSSQPNGSLTSEERKNNIYLSCFTTVQGNLEVQIPDSSRLNFDKLTPEELDERLSGLLVEPADTTGNNFGFCFDIGTTTISGQLVNLGSKNILGTRATYNQQAAFGSDVITRIIYAAKPGGLQQLHNCVCGTINQIIEELISVHKVELNNVNSIVCAGNTTMIHLLLNMDPAHIRRLPYVPKTSIPLVLPATKADINISTAGILRCVPGVSSYVGGDTTAGILSSGLYQKEKTCILIDIGTNGEIVLGNRDFLIACAASAGPAFEGSGLTCGMRASGGAIQKIQINKDDFNIEYSVIQGKKPHGICGSGYIDLLCEMLDAGIIDKNGRIKAENRRIRKTDTAKEFVVCFKEETDGVNDIVITEADIENLKRSKGAIYAATSILVKHLGLDFSGIEKFYIAGGFGTYLNIEKAIRIGLLPDLERNKFVFIGNSSLAGARQILLSSQEMDMADSLAAKITYFELSVEPGYMEEYSQALYFPHTDLTKFPSLKF